MYFWNCWIKCWHFMQLFYYVPIRNGVQFAARPFQSKMSENKYNFGHFCTHALSPASWGPSVLKYLNWGCYLSLKACVLSTKHYSPKELNLYFNIMNATFCLLNQEIHENMQLKWVHLAKNMQTKMSKFKQNSQNTKRNVGKICHKNTMFHLETCCNLLHVFVRTKMTVRHLRTACSWSSYARRTSSYALLPPYIPPAL